MKRHLISFGGLLGAVLGLVVLTTPSEACSCSLAHPQRLFCIADYAIKAEVLESELVVPEIEITTDTGEIVTQEGFPKRRYKVRIHKAFKTHDALPMEENSTSYIYSASAGGLCGVHLDVGTRYVLTGHLDRRTQEPHTGLCDLVEVWGDMTKEQKKGVSYKYGAACNCTVGYCYQPRCPDPESEDVDEDSCSWSIRTDPGFCYILHSHCRRRDDTGRCRWASTNDFRLCQEAAHKDRHREP